MAVVRRRQAGPHQLPGAAAVHPAGQVTLVECRLETGRTHQVRVHLAAIGHPVVGDDRYGGARPSIDPGRPFLHAASSASTTRPPGERCASRPPSRRSWRMSLGLFAREYQGPPGDSSDRLQRTSS